jgi:N-acetyl-alpha-D-glucosaminyl L-malate synthase BshA
MGDRLRIGVLCHPTYGGSGVLASELALSLAARGHTVHLFSHAVPPRLVASPGPVEMHVSQGVPYPLFSSTPHDLAITSEILNVHRATGLDLLHAHYALPHAVSAVLARSAAELDAGRPAPRVVTTLHGTDVTIVGSDPSYAPLTQFVIASSDAATAVSESLRRDTLQHFCTERRRHAGIEVIPNFVDTKRFHPTAAEPYTKSCFHAVHVSNFRPVKRVPWLVEAFAEATRGTDARLTLVGDGPDSHAVHRVVDELDLRDRVVFLGMRSSLPEVLAPADAFLLTSHEESFGLSALEAMACGVAVVATAAGGVPEVIDDGRSGLLCDVDDRAGFVANLRRLVDDAELCRTMGEEARRQAVTRFDRSLVVQRYEELYRRVLSTTPAADAQPART